MIEDEDMRAKYLIGQPKTLTVGQKFRLILRLLRQQFPSDYPIRVSRVEGKAMGENEPFGYCWLANRNKSKDKRYYQIFINKSCSWSQQFDTILHEWAHTLAWHLVENDKGHGDVFHRCFGNLYRAFVEE